MDKGAKEGSGLDFRKKIEKGIGKWKSSSLPLNSDLSREKKKEEKREKKRTGKNKELLLADWIH